MAVGVAGEIGVGPAAGRDEGEAGAVVGVGGEAAVFGGGAHGDDSARTRGVGDCGEPSLPEAATTTTPRW